MMKIFLKNIPDTGLTFDEILTPEEIKLTDGTFKPLSSLHIKARLERADEAVLAKVLVEGTYEFACGRCLEPFESDRQDNFDLYFEIDPSTESIDFGEEIRQELIISFSSVIVCRDDCRGLCPECGVNHNIKSCTHQSKVNIAKPVKKETKQHS